MPREIIKLAQKLIQINSCNPPGDEREITSFIKNYLKKLGVSSKIYEFKSRRQNIVCKIKSQLSRKKILLTPHTDTVPAAGKWRYPPLGGIIKRGRIYGRGATDCKGNCAVALYLIKRIKEKNIRFKNLDLVFAFCGDEETGSHYGIKPLTRYLKNIDYGLVLDANDFSIIIAQKGLLHIKVEVFGKEAHGAYPHRGKNAVEKAIDIAKEIKDTLFKEGWPRHHLLKKPTLNIGKFHGGEKVNIVPRYCCFEMDIRWLPKMDEKAILSRIRKIIKKAAVPYKLKVIAQQKPIEVDKNSFLIKTMKEVLRKEKIFSPIKASFGATVINFLADKGIESFAFGFGSGGTAHSQDEYIKITNLTRGVKVLEEYLKRIDEKIDKT